MKPFFLLSLLALCLHAQSVLVINSNSDVKKYNEVIEEFAKSSHAPFDILDLSGKNSEEIKQALYNAYPDVVYAVGAKAYQYANEYIPEKEIYFSSIVDWKRFSIRPDHYGVSNELHVGMQLILLKTVFKDLQSVGVVYSSYTRNLLGELTQNAEQLGIKINPVKIDDTSYEEVSFDDTVRSSDAMLIIADPLFLKNEQTVRDMFKSAEKYQKPVIAYHELFLQYGAILVLSPDNPTIGRQVASMIEACNEANSEKGVQYPAGTNIILNKKEAKRIGIEFPAEILSTATEILE